MQSHENYCCHNCSAYIGQFEEISSVRVCRNCDIDLDLSNPSNDSFFVILDPSEHIADLRKTHGKYYNYTVGNRQHEEGHIKDIYDGNIYRNFVRSLPEEDRQNYATAVLNTDGAAKFKCSQYSIWPIYLMINELPAQERINKFVTCGLWFHRNKPVMNVFIDPFVNIMNKLSTDGIKCSIEGIERSIKLFVNCCTVDSVARASLQGVKQFNEHYACSWYLHPGVYTEGSVRYPIVEPQPQLRDDDETIQQMLNVNIGNPAFGVMSPSATINLHYFKIVSGFVPDYLHCCLDGVAKQFCEYYLDSLDKSDIEYLDTLMSSIAVPEQISRRTRHISIRKNWKAREWENFVLYYNIPILSKVLNKKLMEYWLLFAESLHILLKEYIHIDELNRADEMLYEFVAKSEEYFGKVAMTSNLHQMLHISTSVLNFGPLWAHSTYGFESANHYLLQAIQCAKGVAQQIIRFVHISHSTAVVQEKVYQDANPFVKIYCNNILNSRAINVYKPYKITYFDKGCTSLGNFINLELTESSQLFDKMVKDNCLYESSLKRKHRSNNSIARLHDKTYIRILKFIVDSEKQEEWTVCNIIRTRAAYNRSYKEFRIINSISNEAMIIPTRDINCNCILMNTEEKMFICSVPNSLHY